MVSFYGSFAGHGGKLLQNIIGQIFETYWLVTLKDKLFIIDQHAAHEKVKYERFVKQLEEKQISSQLLNPPVIVSLTGKERQILAEHEKDFEALGFELEDFGSDSIAIRSMPVAALITFPWIAAGLSSASVPRIFKGGIRFIKSDTVGCLGSSIWAAAVWYS